VKGLVEKRRCTQGAFHQTEQFTNHQGPIAGPEQEVLSVLANKLESVAKSVQDVHLFGSCTKG